MESQQARLVDDDVMDIRVHNVLKYPCVVCGKFTSFRYGSIPVCDDCSREMGF